MLTSLDVLLGPATSPYVLATPPLPPGFELFAQVFDLQGGTVSASNGVALGCLP